MISRGIRWIAVGAAMGIQECGTEGFDMFAMLRGWEMARESISRATI